MKNELLTIINSKEYQPLTFEEFFTKLELSTLEEGEILKNTLNELLESGVVFLNKKKTRYILPKDLGYYRGRILIKNPNFGFIVSEDFKLDLYVSKYNFNEAMDRDEVLFKVNKYIHKKNDGKSKDEATIIKILKRNIETLVGTVKQRKNSYYLDYDRDDIDKKIKITDLNGASVDDIVSVKITNYQYDYLDAKVLVKVGSKKDIGMDILTLAVEHGFDIKFSDSALYEVNNIESDITLETNRRRNSFDKIIYTIDGDDSKDLDDAISIKKLKNGNYFLGVYIADVSYYVKEGTYLDKDAYSRGTSLYLADRVIPMLPTKLSNDLCSLNPNEEKLAIACEMEIDCDGKIISSELFETVIKTTKRLTYNKCNEVLETKNCVSDSEYLEVLPHLEIMKELADILEAKNTKRGSLDFDVPESKIIVNDKGEAIDVKLVERGISEKIIEVFMILANEAVASTFENLDLPFIYRVHDKPDVMKLQDLKVMAGYLGYSLRGNYATEIQKFLNSIKEEDTFLKTFVLRLMSKAIYSNENIGHFGLASDAYTHFTSPIRRYPDLIVHRLIRKYIFNGDINVNEFRSLTSKLEEIANHSSEKERASIQCEYDVDDMKKAEYMEKFVGKTFEGKISSITNFGMFITLPNTIEGLVRLKDMSDDYYIFNPTLYILKGERTNKRYRIGDDVLVKVVRSDKKMREIDFKLVYNRGDKDERYGKENSRKK